MAQKVQFTETVVRDANQSLMATRMAFSDFAEILPTMDKAGYYSVECWGGATFDSCLRYLNEDLELLSDAGEEPEHTHCGRCQGHSHG